MPLLESIFKLLHEDLHCFSQRGREQSVSTVAKIEGRKNQRMKYNFHLFIGL